MKAALCCILILMLGGCVSIDLGPKHPEHAAGVKFTPPPPPFIKAEGTNVDSIWRNPKNGNAISFLSDCGDTSDPSLKSIEQGVLSGLYPYTYTTQRDIYYEGRAGRRIQVQGTVDGVPSLVDLLIFKRNNCIYILTYVGLEQHHPSDQIRYEEFIERFHAP